VLYYYIVPSDFAETAKKYNGGCQIVNYPHSNTETRDGEMLIAVSK
jgi:hypothetical protein